MEFGWRKNCIKTMKTENIALKKKRKRLVNLAAMAPSFETSGESAGVREIGVAEGVV